MLLSSAHSPKRRFTKFGVMQNVLSRRSISFPGIALCCRTERCLLQLNTSARNGLGLALSAAGKLAEKGRTAMCCAIVGLVAVFLLLTNSATLPSPVADKWFAASPSHVQSQMQASRQALYTLCTSNPHLTCSWTHTWLLMMEMLQLPVQC